MSRHDHQFGTCHPASGADDRRDGNVVCVPRTRGRLGRRPSDSPHAAAPPRCHPSPLPPRRGCSICAGRRRTSTVVVHRGRARGACSSSPASHWPPPRSLLPSVPTYDPWAWLIWGREVLHGDLVTTTGPSWKPFPVLFTTPFAVLGDAGAPLAWLVVARAGGLLAIAMAYRLGRRLAGPVAGIVAAGALTLADEFIFNFFRGNSEGILVAVVPVGDRAPPRRPAGRRLPARRGRRPAAPRDVADPARLRVLPRLAGPQPAHRHDRARRRRPRHGAVVRARVRRVGRLPARRQPGARGEPRLARLRRPSVRRRVRAVVRRPHVPGLRRRADRRGGRDPHP